MAIHKQHAEAFLNKEGCATVSSNNFRFEIDHPLIRGGRIEEVRGMPPVPAFIGSAAACHLLIMKLMEKKEKMELVDVHVKLAADVDHDAAYPGITALEVEYAIKAKNTKEEIEAFLEKSKKACPLFETLSRLEGVKITIKLTVL